jgi:excisionase family DNA binding protein
VDGDLFRIPIAEAARRLGLSVKTLKRLGAEGRLRIVKDGSRLYVPEAPLRTYADEEHAANSSTARRLDKSTFLDTFIDVDTRRVFLMQAAFDRTTELVANLCGGRV